MRQAGILAAPGLIALTKMSKRLKQILHQERFITGQWAEEKAPKHLPWGQSTMESAEDTS